MSPQTPNRLKNLLQYLKVVFMEIDCRKAVTALAWMLLLVVRAICPEGSCSPKRGAPTTKDI
jgi:hypothetical protein